MGASYCNPTVIHHHLSTIIALLHYHCPLSSFIIIIIIKRSHGDCDVAGSWYRIPSCLWVWFVWWSRETSEGVLNGEEDAARGGECVSRSYPYTTCARERSYV